LRGIQTKRATAMTWIESTPLLVIWLVLALQFCAALFVGYRGKSFLNWISRKKQPVDKSDEAIGFLLSAALALLGLLIAFTFSMAANRFDARRQLVTNEANAVGTTYLRLQLVDEPNRTTLSRLLLLYLDARLAFFSAGTDKNAITRADARTGAIETKMWNALSLSVRSHPSATFNSALLQATNDMFDLAAADRVERETRVPATILLVLQLYSLIAALMLGQTLASAHRSHFVAATTLFVLVGLAIALILDLDRPATGTITVSTAPFARAAESIRTMEIARARQSPPGAGHNRPGD